jgi:hypothetical protein
VIQILKYFARRFTKDFLNFKFYCKNNLFNFVIFRFICLENYFSILRGKFQEREMSGVVEMRGFIPPHLTLLNFQELLVNMNSFTTYIPIVQYIILSFNAID